MTRDEAQALKDEVDLILEEAQHEDNDAKHAMGAVNFGDLRCTDVRLDQSLIDDNDIFIAVYIEEASPDAQGLRRYVHAHLRSSKWARHDIYVRTEW